ncbi:hypothetical protein H4687_008241 [Streptomyces stelliscabiei]|uniref:Uncharacterized protein n=1 Tax=Streptomyces stelliscabiei TaxID=146820 RepID=A0A8I0PDE7_9ACTN|nr:hypothetical protein [Streptomyces stelliscabiei]
MVVGGDAGRRGHRFDRVEQSGRGAPAHRRAGPLTPSPTERHTRRPTTTSGTPTKRPTPPWDEVLHEAEEAQTRVTDPEKRRRRRGEAGDAITPDEQAQEESHHD